MSEAEPILAAVDLLAPAFEEAGLDELELEVGELRVRLVRPMAALPLVRLLPYVLAKALT